MWNRLLVLAATCAASLFSAGLPAIDAQQAGFSPERLERLRRYVRESAGGKEFAGVIATVARNGKVAYFENAGFADLGAKRPMRDDTIFRIFSMTKPITSAAVMMLYEEGKFLLDDPVSKYIPAFANVKVLAEEGGDPAHLVALKRPVTVHHLLTHTSGLNNASGYRAAGVREGTLRQMAEKMASVPLSHQPGEAWRYGSSIDLLGALVEIWSGQPFDVFLEQRMFKPLGMNDTAFYVPAEKLDRLAASYQLNEQGILQAAERRGDPTSKPTQPLGGSGLYSTAGDYLRFCQMLLNGGELDGARLLAPATVDFMFLNHVPPSLIPPGGPNNRKGYGFGLGGAVLLDPAASETLSAKGEFNWGGAAGTYFWIDRANKLIGLWMVQRPPFVPEPSKRFKVLAYQALQ